METIYHRFRQPFFGSQNIFFRITIIELVTLTSHFQFLGQPSNDASIKPDFAN